MKNYVINTVLFLFLSIMLSACGDERGSKTFSTRGNGSTNTKTTVPQLNDEQKLEKAQEALDLSKNSLSLIISQMGSEKFVNLPASNGKDWFYNIISKIQISGDESNNSSRFPDAANYFNFDSNGNLVALSNFLDTFNSQAYVENTADAVRVLYTHILSEIHFMLSEGNSLEAHRTSVEWASTFITKHIGQNNIYCDGGANQSILIVNKLTGLAQTVTTDSIVARGISFEDVSLFMDNNANLSDIDLKALENKLKSLAEIENSTDLTDVDADLEFQGDLEKIFSIGEPTYQSGFDYEAEDSNGNKIRTSLNSEVTSSDQEFSLQIEIKKGDEDILKSFQKCYENTGSLIDSTGIESEEDDGTSEDYTEEEDRNTNFEDGDETLAEDSELADAMDEFEDQSPANVEVEVED